MLIDRVRQYVEAILRNGDPEEAHQDDDKLRADVLRWLAEGAKLPNGEVAHVSYVSEIARAALRTEGIQRWYA